jgi:LPXTG-site transpeptidase (sortase) family protein
MQKPGSAQRLSNLRSIRYTYHYMSRQFYHRGSHVLLALIILINGYIIALPFAPTLWYWWQTKSQSTAGGKPLTVRAASAKAVKDTPQAFHADAHHDGLVIPRMMLNTPLFEGPEKDNFNLLNKGAWRLPFASTPGEGGNTVIAGHRFSYTGPRGVFYYLDKLRANDEIGLWYKGKLYLYSVQSSRTVKATEVSVQQPTDDARLTLYTCTPLWNPTDRLVVVATPKGAN